MELSKRMQAVAQMVPSGHVAADVGCDHGFVSIYLVKNGICPHVYAADVRPGPLGRAKEHIAASGLDSSITAVLSDGLKAVPVGDLPAGDVTEGGGLGCKAPGADVMIAAGMGGRLTIRILSDVPQKTGKLTWVVLEPQSEVWLVRRWLLENGFMIVEEEMVLEDGKYYPVIKALNKKRIQCAAAFEKTGEAAETDRRLEICAPQLLGAQREAQELRQQMTAAGLSEEKQQLACDWLGPQLIFHKSAVLLSFLQHTIETDTALLEQMPPCENEGEGAARIRARTDCLKERIEMAGQIVRMIEGEAYDG